MSTSNQFYLFLPSNVPIPGSNPNTLSDFKVPLHETLLLEHDKWEVALKEYHIPNHLTNIESNIDTTMIVVKMLDFLDKDGKRVPVTVRTHTEGLNRTYHTPDDLVEEMNANLGKSIQKWGTVYDSPLFTKGTVLSERHISRLVREGKIADIMVGLNTKEVPKKTTTKVIRNFYRGWSLHHDFERPDTSSDSLVVGGRRARRRSKRSQRTTVPTEYEGVAIGSLDIDEVARQDEEDSEEDEYPDDPVRAAAARPIPGQTGEDDVEMLTEELAEELPPDAQGLTTTTRTTISTTTTITTTDDEDSPQTPKTTTTTTEQEGEATTAAGPAELSQPSTISNNDLVKKIMNELHIITRITFRKLTKHIYIKTDGDNREVLIIPDEKFRTFLGLTSGQKMWNTTMNRNIPMSRWHKAEEPSLVSRSISTMYVYTNIIEDTFVGNTKAPLLRAINVSTSSTTGYVENHHDSFVDPQWHRIKLPQIKEVHIKCTDAIGRPFAFTGWGESWFVINVRKISNNYLN